jgi:hypothetical protein
MTRFGGSTPALIFLSSQTLQLLRLTEGGRKARRVSNFHQIDP